MRIVQEYELFWKRAFEYCYKHQLEPYSFLWYIIVTPSVRFNDSKAFKQFFERFSSDASYPDIAPRLVVYIAYATKIMHLWIKHNFWPKKNTEGLQMLYRLILSDFRRADACTFEEALAEEGDINSPQMLKRSWFIIDSVLKDTNAEQVRQIINKSIEEEDKYTTESTKGAHAMLSMYETDDGLRQFVNRIIYSEHIGDVNDADLAQMLVGKIDNESLVIPAKYTRLMYAGLCALRDMQALQHKLDETYERTSAQLKELQDFYEGQIKTLIEEIEQLRAQTSIKIERIYTSDSDKFELLKQSYESRIAYLEDQLAMYKDQITELTRQPKVEEYTKPFDKPVHIAYFGIKNQLLENKLAQYNVFVKLYNPYNPVSVIPDLPIVFNIDVASHKVWEQIKYKKPLIVTGSNAQILAKRIVDWLASLQF